MTLREEVELLLPLMPGTEGLRIRSEKGAGPMGWDPVDPKEAEDADSVILEGPQCFGALCRIGKEVRYVTGLQSTDCDSRMWPTGERPTLEEALMIVVPQALEKYQPPAGK